MTKNIHPPKKITNWNGLGVGTAKIMRYVTDDFGVGTEIWQEVTEPWKEGDTIIADIDYRWITKWEHGKPYLITKFMNADDELVGVYCDITRPVVYNRVESYFEDLYLDVWQPANAAPVILDEDELVLAVAAGHVTRDEANAARKVALQLVRDLVEKPSLLEFDPLMEPPKPIGG